MERWAEDVRQRRAGRAGTAPGRGARRRSAGDRVGQAAAPGRAWTGTWTSSAPAPSSTFCSAPTPGLWRSSPGRHAAARTAADGHDRQRPGRTAARTAADPDAGPAGPRGPAPAGPLAGVIPPGFAGRVTLTIPAATLLDLADRPGEMAGIGPIDPDLARDLAAAAARSARSTWCVTVTDSQGHAIGHGCARPAPASRRKPRDTLDTPGTAAGPIPPGRPSFTFTPADQPGPPGGYGTWRFVHRDPRAAGPAPRRSGRSPPDGCDHRHQAKGHDPGVLLRHLAQVRHATCTGPGCRRPAVNCDFEHNIPYEAGGRTCLCNGNPKCRFDHRVKQDPRWNAEQLDKRRHPVDHAVGTAVRHRTHPLPDIGARLGCRSSFGVQSLPGPGCPGRETLAHSVMGFSEVGANTSACASAHCANVRGGLPVRSRTVGHTIYSSSEPSS